MFILLASIGITVLLIISAILARRYSLNAVLLAAYLIASPLSVASLIPGVTMIKWGRLSLAGVICLKNVQIIVPPQLGPAGIAIMVIFTLYAAVGLYSDSPFWAVAFKGQTLATILAGLTVITAVRSINDIEKTLFVIVLGSTAFMGILFAYLLLDPTAIAFTGRFYPLGINPNRVAMSAAALVPSILYFALYVKKLPIRVMCFGSLAATGAVLLASGSRAGIALAALYTFAVAFPLLKRPITTFVLGSLVAGAIALALSFVGEDVVTDRITDTTFTRDTPWTKAGAAIADSPIFGQGWVFRADRFARPTADNFHSLYLNLLGEMGVFGFTIVACVFLVVITQALRTFKDCAFYGTKEEFRICCLFGSFFAAPLAHGLFESATLTGNTPATLLFAVGVGGLDKLRVLMAERAEETSYADAFAANDDEPVPDDAPPADQPRQDWGTMPEFA